MDLKETLFALCSAEEREGRPDAAGELAARLLSAFAEVRRDALHNIIGEVHGGQGKRVLLDAHLDRICLAVTTVDDAGFAHIAKVGGVDRRVLPGKPVVILGREPVRGVIACTPPHLAQGQEKLPAFDELLVDTGLAGGMLKTLVLPGDPVFVEAPPQTLSGGRVTCPALDNRAGIAAVLRCCELVAGKPLPCAPVILFSAQEETNEGGAQTGGYQSGAEEAVVVDVTFGRAPGVSEEEAGALGGGPMIGIAASLSRPVGDRLTQLARQEGIPYQLEVMGGKTGTNADVLGVTRGGMATGTLSIPLQSMHTPAEVVALEDIERTARLLAAYLLAGGLENG